jgi:hypothetical protein
MTNPQPEGAHHALLTLNTAGTLCLNELTGNFELLPSFSALTACTTAEVVTPRKRATSSKNYYIRASCKTQQLEDFFFLRD